jgi:predicted AAA+ superfamily ATPase
MEEQYRPLIRQKIIDSLASAPPALTRRDVWLPAVPGKALAVIGMRRAGKTSLLWQILADRLAAGTPREGLLYFSFEDERLAGMPTAGLDVLVDEYFRLQPEWRRSGRRASFFLDEIQLVPGWEVFARRLLETEQLDLFLSGSSARLLSREVASSMRGRAMEAVVLPFSFRESLRHAGQEPDRPVERLDKGARSALDKALQCYLMQGGFPEAQGLDARNRTALLNGYVDVVLLRDVVERHAVSQPLVLRWMVRQLLGNAGGSFSINKFHADLKSQNIAVGKETLHAYLAHLEDAFLLRSIGIATESEQRRRVNPRKAYPVDMGLIPVFDRSGRSNTGHALETAVALELERRGAELAYVHTAGGFEVDFLARFADGRQQLVQVCASLDSADTRARELRALADAHAEYPQAERLLIALDMPPVLELPAGVVLASARDWLLAG